MIIDPHKGRDEQADLLALRRLHDEGAFLIPCKKDKRPARSIKHPITGKWVRPEWAEIEAHAKAGGWVGYYNCGQQGLLVLDFDPMVEEWLDNVADALGAPPLAWWYSSGKVKPAKDGKPEGYGAHAVWKAMPDMGTKTRRFSYVTDGLVVGEIFSGDPGFYFIVYNPVALVDAMDADDCECVDPADIPPACRPAGLGGGANYCDDWIPDQNSRHDSTVSAVASAAHQFDRRERFSAELIKIKEKFVRAVEGDGQRDWEGEWTRIENHGWGQWERDRKREAEERQAVEGKAQDGDPPAIQEALAMAQFDRTKIAIADIAKRKGQKAQPAIPMIKAVKVVAANIAIPDANAKHEVEALLLAGSTMGVEESVIVDTRGKYLNEWRTANKVKMHLGDFPLCSISLGGLYGTKSEAEAAIKATGGVAMPPGFQCRSSDEVMAAIRATGVRAVWSELDTCITLEHEAVNEWKRPARCEPPDFSHVMQLQKGIIRSIMTTKKCQHPSKTDENGKPLIAWRAVPVMVNEMNAKSFVSKMFGQIGNEIPRVDYTKVLTEWVMAKRDEMTAQERADAVELASSWLLRIPFVKVVDAERNEALARLASKICYAVFFHRRFQFMEEGVAKPYSQRYVPVFGGAKRVGKTTIAKSLFPNTGVFKNRIESGFAWDSDDNNMKRKVSGMLVVINDEMAGIRSAKADRVKSFITWSHGAYHEKFKNYEEMVRSDVLIATANQSNDIPSDAALRDRFLFVNLEAAEGYTDKERHDGIVQWFKDNHTALMVGGLIMAEENVDLNPPIEVDDMRSEAVVALDSSNNSFNDAIMGIVEQGLYSTKGKRGPVVSLCLVALHAGLLKYQRDVWEDGGPSCEEKTHLRGDVIRPSDAKGDPDFEWSADVQEAFKVRRNERNQTGALTQIKDAIRTLHGDDALDERHQPPMVDGVRGARFRGFVVQEGRLAKHWNTGGSE